jgi:hypothetical protein
MKARPPRSVFRIAVSTALLFLMILATMGYFPAFSVRQLAIRKEIKQRIKEGVSSQDLHTIGFSAEQASRISWMRKGKELRFNGEMYDVVRSKRTADSVYYYCINDEDEKMLFAKLDELVSSEFYGESSRTHSVETIMSFILGLHYLDAEALRIDCPVADGKPISLTVDRSLPPGFIEPLVHPPSLS